MKGIVLAGGLGTRLSPLTVVTNKHLLPVGEMPMIYYPVKKLIGAGISEILIVTGCEHIGQVVNQLKSGRDFGCNFTYRVQDEPGGIAQALGLAKDFIGSEKMAVILGDNIFYDALGDAVESFEKSSAGAKIFLKEVEDPKRFGVAEIENSKIISIEEKPKKPKSNLAVTGIYFYDSTVFKIITTLKPSGRGELEITDVNNAYMRDGNIEYEMFEGYWSDAGTFESLARATSLVKENPAKF